MLTVQWFNDLAVSETWTIPKIRIRHYETSKLLTDIKYIQQCT